mmetsp:Transcript_59814/g.185404  ORF Transcript_59814/g.185404 Transcript_59814/m.185404 type:complete len:226 (-) Transcript_59814:447-1124(-)
MAREHRVSVLARHPSDVLIESCYGERVCHLWLCLDKPRHPDLVLAESQDHEPTSVSDLPCGYPCERRKVGRASTDLAHTVVPAHRLSPSPSPSLRPLSRRLQRSRLGRSGKRLSCTSRNAGPVGRGPAYLLVCHCACLTAPQMAVVACWTRVRLRSRRSHRLGLARPGGCHSVSIAQRLWRDGSSGTAWCAVFGTNAQSAWCLRGMRSRTSEEVGSSTNGRSGGW